MTRAWRGTGQSVEVTADRQLRMRDRFEERYAAHLRQGAHLWVATVPFYVTVPLTEQTLLDAENMMHDPAVGCYICEQAYTPRLAQRRCMGEPR